MSNDMKYVAEVILMSGWGPGARIMGVQLISVLHSNMYIFVCVRKCVC